ncbi:hypothetical protein F5X68DRAFT_80664 [Plectosphaerella plurivora]|uniref:Uncharacterized protein n=1 Tax=Plectosphaerella plurivora TaxID=936078 RepID=A0A9P8VDM9_9PEZI|nr:hypothetical protein F5X68DRAFT_80664 [Plectosphaerella plurivora]
MNPSRTTRKSCCLLSALAERVTAWELNPHLTITSLSLAWTSIVKLHLCSPHRPAFNIIPCHTHALASSSYAFFACESCRLTCMFPMCQEGQAGAGRGQASASLAPQDHCTGPPAAMDASRARMFILEGPTALLIGALIFISVPSSPSPKQDAPRPFSWSMISGASPATRSVCRYIASRRRLVPTAVMMRQEHPPEQQKHQEPARPPPPSLLLSATPPFLTVNSSQPTRGGGDDSSFSTHMHAGRVGDTLRKTGFGAASWTSSLQGLRLGSPIYP